MSFLKQLEWGVTLDPDSAVKNCLAFPPSDPTPAPANGGGDGVEDAPDDPQSDYVGINDLVESLSTHLPDTKIRVFKVPAQKRNK